MQQRDGGIGIARGEPDLADLGKDGGIVRTGSKRLGRHRARLVEAAGEPQALHEADRRLDVVWIAPDHSAVIGDRRRRIALRQRRRRGIDERAR